MTPPVATQTSLADELVAAVRKNDLDGARDLLQRGADVNEKNPHGITPVMWAEGVDVEMVRLLLDHGARTDDRDFDGYSAIDIAAMVGDEATEQLLATISETRAAAEKERLRHEAVAVKQAGIKKKVLNIQPGPL